MNSWVRRLIHDRLPMPRTQIHYSSPRTGGRCLLSSGTGRCPLARLLQLLLEVVPANINRILHTTLALPEAKITQNG